MKEQFARRLFVWRTRLSVAYSNFTVSRAFSIGEAPWRFVAAPLALTVIVILFFGAAAGAAYFTRTPVGVEVETVAVVPAPAVISIPAVVPEDRVNIDMDFQPSYAIAVDKHDNRLFVLEEHPEYYKVVQAYAISLGEILGVKERKGDLRTPVGYYRIIEVKDGDALPSIYGPRAFVLNYPNSFDTALGRSGGGIWLHGSGQGQRTPDTRGCVELNDEHIIALSEWVDIDTPVAIFPRNFPLPVVDGRIDKQFMSTRFFYGDISDFNAG